MRFFDCPASTLYSSGYTNTPDFPLGNTSPYSMCGGGGWGRVVPTTGSRDGKVTQAFLVLCHMIGSGVDTGQNVSHSKGEISTRGLC